MHFFSSAHGKFFKIDHTLHPKTNLNKFKKTEITQNIFFSNSGIKLKSVTENQKIHKCVEINQHNLRLDNQCVKVEVTDQKGTGKQNKHDHLN